MSILYHPGERLVRTILYEGVALEVIERPEVIWVGCVDYAANNQDESDIGATLKRYREELIDVPKRDERYDVFKQPSGLWLRIRNDRNAAALLGKESAETHEYFSDERKILRTAAEANHYRQNSEVCIEVEYNCHAEYGNPSYTSYAYIPILKLMD